MANEQIEFFRVSLRSQINNKARERTQDACENRATTNVLIALSYREGDQLEALYRHQRHEGHVYQDD